MTTALEEAELHLRLTGVIRAAARKPDGARESTVGDVTQIVLTDRLLEA